MRVLFFGTYDELAHPRVRVLREGLETRGALVEVCNVPLGFDTAARVRLAAEPWRAAPFLLRLLVTWIRLLWRSRKSRTPDVVVVGYLGAFDVHVARLRFRHALIVLDEMVSLAETVADRGLDGPTSRLGRLLHALDRRAEHTADLIVVDTDAQADRLDSDQDRVVVRVGAPAVWMETTPSAIPSGDEPVRAVFFGLYTPLQGAPVIGEALSLLGTDVGLEVTMIGDGQDRTATEAAAAGSGVRTEWIDWIDAVDLPTVVADHQICLGIFATSAKANRVVPNKIFQGAAAGAALVTADTPTQRAMLGDAAVYVPAGDASALAAVLRDLASDADALDAARHRARAWADEACNPEQVVEELQHRLQEIRHGA